MRFGQSWNDEAIVPTRGAALRYDDYAAAAQHAEAMKRLGRMPDYTVEEVNPPKIRKESRGNSGRA